MRIFNINNHILTEADKKRFLAGWGNAGGYIGDINTPAPWCMPWLYTQGVDLPGKTPEEWGEAYWIACGRIVEQCLAK